MPDNNGYDANQQKDYEREARLTYGPDQVNESIGRWNNYSDAQQQAIINEGNAIYARLAHLLRTGHAPHSEATQQTLKQWHEHLRHFYEPSLDTLAGLAQLYNTDERFMATFQAHHADLPAYLQEAIGQYVDELETALLEEMLANEENEMQARVNKLSD